MSFITLTFLHIHTVTKTQCHNVTFLKVLRSVKARGDWKSCDFQIWRPIVDEYIDFWRFWENSKYSYLTSRIWPGKQLFRAEFDLASKYSDKSEWRKLTGSNQSLSLEKSSTPILIISLYHLYETLILSSLGTNLF